MEHIRDRIADNHDHVAIIDQIDVVVDVAIGRNDRRTATLMKEGKRANREIEDMVQSVDLTLNAAASRNIDRWKPAGIQNPAGHHDIRAAEEHNTVAVSVRRSFSV